MNANQISAAKTAELLAFYNANAEAAGFRPTARFADRATAERRVLAVIEVLAAFEPIPQKAAAKARAAAKLATFPGVAAAIAAPAAYVQGTCPKCGDSTNGITTGRVIDRKEGQVLVDEHKAMCHVCGHEFHFDTGRPLRKAPAANPNAAAAISASWADEAVRLARITHHGVKFTDASGARQFRSVRQAFEQLGLPLGRHISFRGQLKAAGKLEGFGGKWTLIAA